MANELWGELHRLGREQGGVVGTWQATDLGIPTSSFHDVVTAHGYQQLVRGVWGLPGSRHDYRRRAWAALVATRSLGLLTAQSALWAAGALDSPRGVALWTPPALRLDRRPGIRYHRGRWVAGDRRARFAGLPAVPVLRAWTDLAADVSADRLATALAALHRLRHATRVDAAAYLRRRGRFPGVARARVAIEALDRELVHSGMEGLARRLLRQADVTGFHSQPLMIVVDEVVLGEVDIPFADVRYGVEVDGPHHDIPSVAAADKARDRRLHRKASWIIDRFPEEQIKHNPEHFVSEVKAGLSAARARHVEPWPR